jgi:hypothetical protein
MADAGNDDVLTCQLRRNFSEYRLLISDYPFCILFLSKRLFYILFTLVSDIGKGRRLLRHMSGRIGYQPTLAINHGATFRGIIASKKKRRGHDKGLRR